MLARAEENGDAHHQACLAAIERLHADAEKTGARTVCILLLQPSSPAPPAHWRQRFADAAARSAGRESFFGAVTTSPVQRGVLRVIGWLVGGEVSGRPFDTFEHAMQAAEEFRGEPLPELKTLRTRAERMLADAG